MINRISPYLMAALSILILSGCASSGYNDLYGGTSIEDLRSSQPVPPAEGGASATRQAVALKVPIADELCEAIEAGDESLVAQAKTAINDDNLRELVERVARFQTTETRNPRDSATDELDALLEEGKVDAGLDWAAGLDGVAKPMPSKFPDSENIEELMPTSSPRELMRAPPELPGLIAASV